MPQQDPESLARRIREVGLADLKIELAVVVMIVLGTLMVVVRIDAPYSLELLGTTLVGLLCGGWIASRTRRTAAAAAREQDGTHEE